ncbi:S-protein homolog 5-like [Rhododendron vialii]|uniref:S-protein homolog 5-like n=1 Tax=Rhododendron vialii TaxID=182163 RepID=UPI00265D9781|nr:S-protein homolog 5-like [Rhododendron vialii]
MGHCFVSFLINLTLILQLACAQLTQVGDHIISGVPNNLMPLRAHCQSKDDDLGMHMLNNGQSFNRRFTINFWGTTLFFCHFYWGSHNTSFDVFNATIADRNWDFPRYDCYWVARPDGFYLSKDNKSWEIFNDWT